MKHKVLCFLSVVIGLLLLVTLITLSDGSEPLAFSAPSQRFQQFEDGPIRNSTHNQHKSVTPSLPRSVPTNVPLVEWSNTPPGIAMRAFPLGRFVSSNPNLLTPQADGLLGSMLWTGKTGLPPELVDLHRRSFGLLIALDHVLLTNLQVASTPGSRGSPADYFPLPVLNSLSIPDVELVEKQIIELLEGGMDSLAEQLPTSLRQAEELSALRSRAILLLGTTGTTEASAEFLQRVYSSGSIHERSAASIALAYLDRPDAASQLLSTSSDSRQLCLLLAGLSNGFLKKWYAVEQDSVTERPGAFTPIARSLDDQIIQLCSHPDAEVQKVALAALVPRQDNPTVRAALIEELCRVQDPFALHDMLSMGPLLDRSPKFQARLLDLTTSPHSYLRVDAILKLAPFDSAEVISKLITCLDDEHPKVREASLTALSRPGRSQKVMVREAIHAAVRKWKQHAGLRALVPFAEERANIPVQVQPDIHEWLRKHPEHLLR